MKSTGLIRFSFDPKSRHSKVAASIARGNAINARKTTVYPLVGSDICDLGFVRVSGVGLGNSFFNYFHAVRLAERFDATVISPAWASLKPRRILRGHFRDRFYGNLFKRHPSEITGVTKLGHLVGRFGSAVLSRIDPNCDGSLVLDRLNLVGTSRYEFGLLHNHRTSVRNRLLTISRHSAVPAWGSGGFIAMHVRLGDFIAGTRLELERGHAPNLRIPMQWYLSVFQRLRSQYPTMQVVAYSDGSEAELAPLTEMGVKLHPKSSDLDDLLSMSSANLLVGANSTYSRWAAFLGNMPSIWLESALRRERPTAADVPISYLDLDALGSLNLVPIS